MSLWTDGELITAEHMAAVDSSVPRVAAAEDIVLEGDASVIRQAWTEVGHSLLEWMQTFNGDLYPGVFGTVLSSGLYASNRSRWLLNQVVSTSQYSNLLSPLAAYALHYAMTLFWKEAARRTDKDKYLGKLDQSEEDKKQAKRRLWSSGIPIVWQPLSAPGALFDPLAGMWSSANVGPGNSAGTITEETSYDVAITWVDRTNYVSPLQRGNAESGPSAKQTLTLQSGQSLKVTLMGLMPPGSVPYQVGVADGIRYSRNASGWNVYAGPSGSPSLTLQNATPLGLSEEFETATVAIAGMGMMNGQFADLNQRLAIPFGRG